MSLRPRFSNYSLTGRQASSSGDTANQDNTTVKDHGLISAPRYYRLSVLFLIMFASLYLIAVFTNLGHYDDRSNSNTSSAFVVVQARVLRGLLGVVHVNQKGSIRIPTTTKRQEHPRMVRYNMLDGTVEIYNNQQRAAAGAAGAVSSSFRNSSRGVVAMVVQVELMSSTVQLQEGNTIERESKKKLGLADPLETRKCKAQYQWQLDSKITCNSMHEIDLGHLFDKKSKVGGDYNDDNVLRERVRLIAEGGWRDVWGVLDHYHHRGDVGHSEDINDNTATAAADNNKNNNIGYVVLKTLLYPKDVVPRNVERHRRDAMATERLTSSPNIVDIYSFCGNSGVYEFADGGDLDYAVRTLDKAWRSTGLLTREEKLQRLHFGAYYYIL
jgi:hypothetical protein